MTTPTRDELALYAIGHYDGDAAALERRVDEDPEAATQLAEEAELASLLRAAVREATFCPRCHDLVSGERCACEVAVPRRRATGAFAIAAATLAAAVAIGLLMRRGDDASPTSEPARSKLTKAPAEVPPPTPMDAAPVDANEQPAAPPADKKQSVPTKPISKDVKLNIVTRPRGVVVMLDGQYRGMTPLVLRVPRSSTPGALSLRHIAYHTLSKQLALSSDITVDVSLQSTGAPVPHDGRFKEEQCMLCHKPN